LINVSSSRSFQLLDDDDDWKKKNEACLQQAP
jgi:hypothetical protein